MDVVFWVLEGVGGWVRLEVGKLHCCEAIACVSCKLLCMLKACRTRPSVLPPCSHRNPNPIHATCRRHPQVSSPTLSTCQQMVQRKPAFAELLLPHAFADLARHDEDGELSSQLAHSISRHMLPEVGGGSAHSTRGMHSRLR